MSEILQDVRNFLKTQGLLTDTISLKDTDSLTDTGVIDSIILLQLVDFLENKYKVEIPLEMLTPENFDTLDGINRSVTTLMKG